MTNQPGPQTRPPIEWRVLDVLDLMSYALLVHLWLDGRLHWSIASAVLLILTLSRFTGPRCRMPMTPPMHMQECDRR